MEDTRPIVETLKRRFPGIHVPAKDDICYATQNRQVAVRALAKRAPVILVVGSRNSSNSNRLVEEAVLAGARAYLIDDVSEIDFGWLEGVETLGITSGASAPEFLVQGIVRRLGGPGVGGDRGGPDRRGGRALPAAARGVRGAPAGAALMESGLRGPARLSGKSRVRDGRLPGHRRGDRPPVRRGRRARRSRGARRRRDRARSPRSSRPEGPRRWPCACDVTDAGLGARRRRRRRRPLRADRRPRQQRRARRRDASRGRGRRPLGRDPRDQPDGRLPRHARRGAAPVATAAGSSISPRSSGASASPGTPPTARPSTA